MLKVEPKPERTTPTKQERARQVTTIRLAFAGIAAVVLLFVVGGVLKWTGFLSSAPPPRPVPQPGPRPQSSGTVNLLSAGPVAFLEHSFTRHTAVSVLVLVSILTILASAITLIVVVGVPRWFPPKKDPELPPLVLLQKDPDQFVTTYPKRAIAGILAAVVIGLFLYGRVSAAVRQCKGSTYWVGFEGNQKALVDEMHGLYAKIETAVGDGNKEPWAGYQTNAKASAITFVHCDESENPKWMLYKGKVDTEKSFAKVYSDFIRYYKAMGKSVDEKTGPFIFVRNGGALKAHSIDTKLLKLYIDKLKDAAAKVTFLTKCRDELKAVREVLKPKEEPVNPPTPPTEGDEGGEGEDGDEDGEAGEDA